MTDPITIKKGLDLPIAGAPEPRLEPGHDVGSVALLGNDYVGMKPFLAVAEGYSVRLGQTLFVDRNRPAIRFTSPASGRVRAIHRGKKRRFLSLVIDLEGDNRESFRIYEASELERVPETDLRESLVASGLWTTFRTRPYNRIPDPAEIPRSIFVAAMDTHPLAMNPAPWIAQNREPFEAGLTVLSRLTDGQVFVCSHARDPVNVPDSPSIVSQPFAGPHPSGLPGTHIHYLDPVNDRKTVWFLNYQDVVATGHLFLTGDLPMERVIAIGGAGARNPRLLRTRIGASLEDLLKDEILAPETTRVISGSVLSGRSAQGPENWLGRFHLQVSLLPEGDRRDFINWLLPGMKRFSIRKVYGSSLSRGRKLLPFSTSNQGSERAMVPIGMFESVMPLDILPTHLLRALVVGDNEQAQDLGCLELDEDDLALCSFVCPGKTDYGTILRERLEEIEKEG